MDSNFVHLHVHSEYSTLDGVNKVEELPKIAKSLGQEAIALTDHGNVSGARRFYKACIEEGIKPIIGMEAYYTVEDRFVKKVDDLESSYYHLVLIALNNVGWKNLCKLSSYAYTEGKYRKPRIDDDLLGQYSEGIVATTACIGSRLGQLILKNRLKDAEVLLDHHKSLFGNRLLVELQLHQDEEHKLVTQTLLQLASKKNMAIILTNDCHYPTSDDAYFHEIALCMQTKDVLSNPNHFSFGDIDVHVAHHDWMHKKAKAIGLPYEAIINTVALADMVDSNDYFSDRMNRYPKYKWLQHAINSWEELEVVCKKRLADKLGGTPPQIYRERINYELNIIKRMGFSDYLLIVCDFLDGARERGVYIGPGRGSAAGSLVAFALNITTVDPIKYGLLFERFLNYGRSAKPLILAPEHLTYIEESKKHSTCDHKHKCEHSH